MTSTIASFSGTRSVTEIPSRLRLYTFPFGGGGTLSNSWIEDLPVDVLDEIEICSVSLPGHTPGCRELPYRDPRRLLDFLDATLGPTLKPPYAFFGHSMGALLSFEVARRMSVPGRQPPVHMIVSGFRAPHIRDRRPPVHKLPDREIHAKLIELGGTPTEVANDPEVMDLFLPLVRADLALCESYRYEAREPLSCSLTAFSGNGDPQASVEEVYAWHAQVKRDFSFHIFAGSHFFFHQSRSSVLKALAHDLRQVLVRL